MNRFFMVLTLLPFFSHFRGTPHQLAAIKELEDALPEELLRDDAAWFEAWKASGIAQQVVVPYFHQLDNKSGQGYRECFSSSAAMVAAFYGKVKTDDQYNKIRKKFGNTTSIEAQVSALKSLGLHAEFRQDGNEDLIEAEISAGRPVAVGWLHRGDMSRGEPPMCDNYGCGHWSVIVGFDKENWIMNDPRGTPFMERGGHSRYGGKNVKVLRQAFQQRWEVEGPGTGWLILADDE
tara:strand:- start:845 stop:1549 length:705 start_codon:yes stop_codon:yes gene_type:complete